MVYIIKLYLMHLRLSIKAGLQFKADFIAAWIANIITYLIYYVQAWILTRNFPVIGGWTYTEILLLMAMQFVSYAVANTALYGVSHNMDEYINRGDLDRILTRPVNPIFSIIWKEFNWSGISQIFMSEVFLIYALINNGIVWSIQNKIILLVSLIGAIILQCGVFLLFGAAAFWIRRSSSLLQLLFYNFSSFSNYPVTIFGKMIRILLSTVLPWAYINFYPAAKLLEKDIPGQSLYVLTPVIGCILLFLGVQAMKYGLSKYESVGN